MRASTASSSTSGAGGASLGPVRMRSGRSARSGGSSSSREASATARSNQERLWALQQQAQQTQSQSRSQSQTPTQSQQARYGFVATAAPASSSSHDAPPSHLYNAWRGTPTPPSASQPTAAYGLAGYGYADATAAHHPQPPHQPLQPRPPAQSHFAASQSQQLPPPPHSSRAGRAGGSRTAQQRPARDDSPSPPTSPIATSAHHSRPGLASTASIGTAASASASGTASASLHEKVAAALQELESIKSNSYRPNTAGPLGGGGGSGWSEGTLPRPNLSAAPFAAAAAAAAASATGAARAASASESRTAAELRTAKSIVRKLYKRNVKLVQELNLMRSNRGLPPSDRSDAEQGRGQFALEADESQLLEEGAHDDHRDRMQHAGRAAGDESQTHESEEERLDEHADEGEDDGEQGGAVDGAVTSPRSSRRDRRRLASAPGGSSDSKAGGAGAGMGGPSHLLFLLGERDTTLNKQQATITALQRKVHSLTARLQLAQGGRSDNSAAGATPGAGDADGDGSNTGAASAGGDMEHLQSQLSSLRSSLSSRLRAQLTQLSYCGAAAGETPPSARVVAYIRDLEKWLVWEASWRQVEKSALNAQCMRAEKQAQDSWVRARLVELELREWQQRLQRTDAKLRAVDTQLAAALERNRLLDAEIVRLRK